MFYSCMTFFLYRINLLHFYLLDDTVVLVFRLDGHNLSQYS